MSVYEDDEANDRLGLIIGRDGANLIVRITKDDSIVGGLIEDVVTWMVRTSA